MLPDPDRGVFRHLLVGIPDATDYFVEAEGVRSPTYRIEVEDVPRVARISLTYRYPAHTGLGPREVEDGGDIAGVAGTVVELVVQPTVAAAAGVLRREPGGLETPLAPGEASPGPHPAELTASLSLAESGSYRIALAGPDGELRTASRDYAIEVLEDLPPIVRFLRPARDIQASPVEEIFTEVRAEDDYAVERVEIRLSVNGGAEERALVASGGARDSVQSGHTLFLEERDLVPGDLVSYYALARDGAGAEASTDLFFVAIRPFDRTYRQADSMPGGGGAGGGRTRRHPDAAPAAGGGRHLQAAPRPRRNAGGRGVRDGGHDRSRPGTVAGAGGDAHAASPQSRDRRERRVRGDPGTPRRRARRNGGRRRTAGLR